MIQPNKRKFDLINPMKLHLVLNAGGMGDIIHCIPAVKSIIAHYPWQNYHVWVPDYLVELFKKALPKVKVGAFKDSPKKCDGVKEGIICFDEAGRHSSMRTHLTDYAFFMLMDRLPYDNTERNFSTVRPKANIKRFNLPEKYVVISPYFRSTLRQMLPGHLNKIRDLVKQRGYSVVLLGSAKQPYNGAKDVNTNGARAWDGEGCIDLCEKTSVLEALEILWGAHSLITMDGGLMHLCCLTKTPVVAGFTSVDPKTRLPYKSGELTDQVRVVEPDVSCKYCQSTWCMVYNTQHNFNDCFFKDFQCVKEITYNKVIKQWEKI